MQSLEGSSNEELLASLAGRSAAARLMGKFGGLSSLAQASFADLQQVPGVGPSKAGAIRSAFLLAHRLVRETHPDAPVVDSPEREGQWGRSRTFYISSFSRSPSLGNHGTHFSNVRTNPQTLPTWRHFGNALQPRKRPPVLGPSFASRSTRGLPHRGQILRSGPCGTCWSGNGIAVRFQSVESVQSVDPTAFSRSRLRLAVSMQ